MKLRRPRLFDMACQFANAECADAAALQLAAALRADAEAVINPDVSPEELTEVLRDFLRCTVTRERC